MMLTALAWLSLACAAVSGAPTPAEDALFKAVGANSMADLKKALEAGASINTIGPGGQSPLMHAVLGGKETAVKYLLRKGADTTIAEKDGYTPMHGAGFQGRAAIAKLLLDHGIDARSVHSDGFEPMHRALWGGEPRHTDTVRAFLEAGVPVAAPAANGQTPLEMVRNNRATTALLNEWLAKTESTEGAEGSGDL